LLHGIDHWHDPVQDREGFSLSCTVLDLSFYATELRATVQDG
jgi:hypothetical protein